MPTLTALFISQAYSNVEVTDKYQDEIYDDATGAAGAAEEVWCVCVVCVFGGGVCLCVYGGVVCLCVCVRFPLYAYMCPVNNTYNL